MIDKNYFLNQIDQYAIENGLPTMRWKAIELTEDYWIIQNPDTMEEYVDSVGDNLMFTTKEDAEARIREIEEDL